MANKKSMLPLGEVLHVEGIKYKIRHIYRGKSHNRYLFLVSCSICGKSHFAEAGNFRRNKKHYCSPDCLRVGFTGENNYNWNGGIRHKHGSHGPLLKYAPEHPLARKSYVPLSRLVVEQYEDRVLGAEEIVHHIDMNELNNAIENLFTCGNNREHFLIHGSVNKCVADLFRFGVLSFDPAAKRYVVLRERLNLIRTASTGPPRIIGIDPGLDGAVALFSGTCFNQVVSAPVLQARRRQHDIRRMAALLRRLKDKGLCHAFIERSSSRPGNGVASMFTFGAGFGLWLGILTALEIPHTLVPPQHWHKMVKGVAAGTPKERARLFFNTHFPGVSCKVKQVDAVLIGYWGARQLSSGDGFAHSTGM